MEHFYYVILGFLVILAAFDLYVGVSNDASNFLNSALGCRVASFRTTMWVASLGVLLGTTFSSGMMEIARSGVFHPQMFSFTEILAIFFAVMVADLLLLDTFNSLGLPTSTTVSIIFELLGSALAAAVYKLYMNNMSFADIALYINSAKALTIISGILISVGVAFVTGAVVQYITRLIFTFHFEDVYKKAGGIFAGIAITAIFYFLIIKGAKGSSFMRPEWLLWIDANTLLILFSLFVTLTIIFQSVILLFNTNVFRIIILSGTFSLAFAFAGNDLVNFIGVPLAALDSVRDFASNGTNNPDTFMMESLLHDAPASTIFLLLSGVVMVVTLWFSKKARRVIQTSINLSSSQAGEQEQFGSSLPGRMIVRSSMTLGNIVRQIIPGSMQVALHSRFKPRTLARGEDVLPFDYVRASVNLVLSSILIASATSLKLPLSTTYVTFMVAMGSSFADGAWDRETAVYRISGVLTVISGWFLTAFTACSLAAIMCFLVMIGGNLMACALILLTVAFLVRSNFIKSGIEKKQQRILLHADRNSVRESLNNSVGTHLSRTVDIFSDTVSTFLDDNESGLRRLKAAASTLFDTLSQERSYYYGMAQQPTNDTKLDRDARYCYYRAYTNMREIGRSLQRLTTIVKDHVANRHRVYHGELKRNLIDLSRDLQKLTQGTEGRHALEPVQLNSNEIINEIDRMQSELLLSISSEGLSMRGCELYLTFLQFARELVNRYSIVAVLQQELNELCDQDNQLTSKDKLNFGQPHDKSTESQVSAKAPRRILQALHVKKTPRNP